MSLDKDEVLELVGRRNTVSFQQALIDVREQASQRDETVRLLSEGLAAALTRLGALETQLLHQRAAHAGHGPSAR